jgi:predicted enzyme related to lactoylglutathione lyase
VCLWEPGDHVGAALVNEVGCLCWNELVTPEPDAATEFYARLFGWSAETADHNGARYTTIKVGDRTSAGSCTAPWRARSSPDGRRISPGQRR